MKARKFWIHYRVYDNGGGERMERGGVTACVQQLESGETFVAFAVCSLVDAYCKRTGRAISEGRLQSNVDRQQWVRKVADREGITDDVLYKDVGVFARNFMAEHVRRRLHKARLSQVAINNVILSAVDGRGN